MKLNYFDVKPVISSRPCFNFTFLLLCFTREKYFVEDEFFFYFIVYENYIVSVLIYIKTLYVYLKIIKKHT